MTVDLRHLPGLSRPVDGYGAATLRLLETQMPDERRGRLPGSSRRVVSGVVVERGNERLPLLATVLAQA
jgi:hypothetical protein